MLVGHAQIVAPHGPIQGHVPIQAHQIALVTVSCSANPARVFAGATVLIQAEGRSMQGLALRYSFATDAGQLSESGPLARLNTAGLSQRTVHITCTATEATGRSASQAVEVAVMGEPHTEDLHLPAHPGQGTATVPAETPMKKGDEAKPPAMPTPPAPDHRHETATPAPAPAPTPAEPAHEMPNPAAPKPAGQGAAPATPEPGAQGAATAPARSPAAPAPAQPAVPDVYKSSTEMERWVNELKQGKIEYKVPQKMLLLHAATVTVVIHGFQDVNGTALEQPTGSAPLKQSPRMKVELLAEDNPDDFTIALENGDMAKDVQNNGATTWIWKVTPNKSGAKQRIKILVSLLYPNTDKSEIPLEDYHTTVEVDVASLWSTIVDDYQHDPMKFFSYMIPGGAGFTFIAGLVVWWWKRKHKDERE